MCRWDAARPAPGQPGCGNEDWDRHGDKDEDGDRDVDRNGERIGLWIQSEIAIGMGRKAQPAPGTATPWCQHQPEKSISSRWLSPFPPQLHQDNANPHGKAPTSPGRPPSPWPGAGPGLKQHLPLQGPALFPPNAHPITNMTPDRELLRQEFQSRRHKQIFYFFKTPLLITGIIF